MIKSFLIIFVLHLSVPVFSQDINVESMKIQGSKELPLELNLLVQTAQDLTKDKQEFLQTILKIDSYARLLSKEDIFLIAKIEIYKSLLKGNDLSPRASIDGDTITLLKSASKKVQAPSLKWFLQALLQDCESILSSPLYKDYALQKNSGKLEKLELKKLDKKIKLIYRWTSKININSEDFENTLMELVFPAFYESLKNVEVSFSLMALTAGNGQVKLVTDLKDLKYFSFAKPKAEPKPVKKEKSVDDILAPVIQEPPAESVRLPEPSKEDWLQDENTPANLKNLPKPSDDADWLQDI